MKSRFLRIFLISAKSGFQKERFNIRKFQESGVNRFSCSGYGKRDMGERDGFCHLLNLRILRNDLHSQSLIFFILTISCHLQADRFPKEILVYLFREILEGDMWSIYETIQMFPSFNFFFFLESLSVKKSPYVLIPFHLYSLLVFCFVSLYYSGFNKST